MAYTVDDINDLKAALALGARVVEYSDRKVEYRSINDMQKTLAIMEREVFGDTTATSGKSAIGSRRIAIHSKGL